MDWTIFFSCFAALWAMCSVMSGTIAIHQTITNKDTSWDESIFVTVVFALLGPIIIAGMLIVAADGK